MRLEIKEGARFGKLTIISEGETLRIPSGQTNRTLKCLCDCGNIKDIRISHLTRNKTISCGCVKKTMNGKSQTYIGKLYRSIKWRCNKNYTEKHLYFEKGITVCDEWLEDFEVFEKWCLSNGYDNKLQIDRVNGNKGYKPSNCRFVTSKVNCNNRYNTFFVEYENEKIPLKMLLLRLNYPNKYDTVLSRIKRGWQIDLALFKKPNNNYSNRRGIK